MKPPVTITHDALGTRFYLEIWDEVSPVHIEVISEAVATFLNQFEKRYSRFLIDSLVSTLNNKRTLTNPDSEFIHMLALGQSLTVRTDGLFNMLLGKTLENRGYDALYSFVPHTTDNPASPQPNPLTDIQISPTIISLHQGNLDLGGFGKGYGIDVLTTQLKETYGLKYFLINGGGDMYATSNHGEPFTIYLEHPLEADTYLGTTQILNQGFAASSPHKRSWVHNDTTYNHIIDTTPEYTPTHLCDASFVIADTCVEADAFATIALMVETNEFTKLAQENNLGFATFTAPYTFSSNGAFIVQNL